MPPAIVRDFSHPVLAAGRMWFEERQRPTIDALDDDLDRLEWYDGFTFFNRAQETLDEQVLGQRHDVEGAFQRIFDTPMIWFVADDGTDPREFMPGYGWQNMLEPAGTRYVTLTKRGRMVFRRVISKPLEQLPLVIFPPVGLGRVRSVHPQTAMSFWEGLNIKLWIAFHVMPDFAGTEVHRTAFHASTFRRLP